MTQLKTTINTGSEEFRANEAHYRGKLDELHELRRAQRIGGPKKARERHVAKGKMLPRERVERLIDPGSPFLELGDIIGPIAVDEVFAASFSSAIKSLWEKGVAVTLQDYISA